MAVGVLSSLRTEVEFSAGTWTDVTAWVRAETGSTGSFGRPNEFEDCAPSTWRFSLRNDDGRFMPDNPLSPYFPNVVENRRVRVTAIKGASSWQRFLGFITSWKPTFPDANGTTGIVEVSAADVLSVLGRSETASGYVEQAKFEARSVSSWCDIFPFPEGASTATSFFNAGVALAGRALGTAKMIPASRSLGSYSVEASDANLVLEGQLVFKPSGTTGPVLKIVPQGGPGQIDFFFKVPPETVVASGGAPLTILDVWTESANLYSLRLYYDAVSLTTQLGHYNSAGALVTAISRGLNLDRVNDEVWRKVTVYDLGLKGFGTGFGVNLDDGASYFITTTALTSATRLVFGGAYAGPSKEGKQTGCPAFSLGGPDVQGADFGVFGYYALNTPPATTSFIRWRELIGYTAGVVERRVITGLTVTAGSTTVTSPTPVFTSDDVGAGGLHATYFPVNNTVAAYVSPTQITTSQPALASSAGSGGITITAVIQGTDVRPVVRVNTADTGDLAEAFQTLARTVGGVVWVNPAGRLEFLMPDAVRMKTPIATIGIEADTDGESIELERSIDSAPTRVTVNTPVGSIEVSDSAADATGVRRDITVETGAATSTDAIAIAGYYLNVSSSLRISQVTVDLSTSTNDLYATLLGSLRPGVRLRFTGLSSTVFGYSTADVYVQGWTEAYSRDAVRLTFDCTPADDPVEGLFEDTEYGRFAVDSSLLLAYDLTSSSTSIQVSQVSTAPVLSTSAGDYPLDLEVSGERMTMTSAPTTTSRTNRCTNPSFETGTAGWSGSAVGYTTSTLAASTDRATYGASSLKVTWPTAVGGNSVAVFSSATTIGQRYSFSISAYVPAGSPAVQVGEAFAAGTGFTYTRQATTGTTGAWVRLGVSFTATATTSFFAVGNVTAAIAGQVCYLDAALIEETTSGVGSYFDGSTNGGFWLGPAHASTSNHLVQTAAITRGIAPTTARAHTAGEFTNVWHEAAFAF